MRGAFSLWQGDGRHSAPAAMSLLFSKRFSKYEDG